MAIVKMKKLRLIGLREDCGDMLQTLSLLGCVEVAETERDGVVLRPMELRGRDWRSEKARLENALALLKKYDAAKQSLFSPRGEISAERFFSDALIEEAEAAAKSAEERQERISALQAELTKNRNLRLALLPWKSMDLDLGYAGTEHSAAFFGATPPSATAEKLREALGENACEIIPVSGSKEQNCLLVLAYRPEAEQVMQLLRAEGFAKPSLGVSSGTPAENIAAAEERIAELTAALEAEKLGFKELSGAAETLRAATDRAAQELQKQEAREKIAATQSAFALEGWLPASAEKRLAEGLEKYACAWELSDPLPEETASVPVKLKNSPLTEPLTMVTEMYSLPAYDGIDPNPLIMPFFALFFGIMYGDIGYGLILLAAGIFAKIRLKPKGTMKYMAGLLVMCGITTIGAGALFGSFFGDAIPVVSEMLGFERADLWRLIDPMTEPLTMLLASMAIGVVQIIVGMAIKVYMLVRDGHPLDALMDVGSWWLLFAGIAVVALRGSWYVCLAGVAALLLTQGRDKPTLIGKIVGGVASLYNITSYLGDILSYARLMALVLATSVLGSVINLLGSMLGPIGFIPVFLVGHGFSMAINLIGTYVHSARLQYLEYFGKFYKDGGRKFDPLAVNTKYVDIV